MEQKTFKTSGTCAVVINFNIDDDGNLHDVKFVGGCDGNLKAIGALVEGRPAKEVAELLKGNTCGRKPTSCADQLARAIME
jgi:uncharacterized protein (TIGR03905 family)